MSFLLRSVFILIMIPYKTVFHHWFLLRSSLFLCSFKETCLVMDLFGWGSPSVLLHFLSQSIHVFISLEKTQLLFLWILLPSNSLYCLLQLLIICFLDLLVQIFINLLIIVIICLSLFAVICLLVHSPLFSCTS